MLQSVPGILSDGKGVIDLVKKVGGFRIGSMPSFQHAANHGGVRQELRKLAPYAQSIIASVRGFSESGEHEDWSLVLDESILRLCAPVAGPLDEAPTVPVEMESASNGF